MKKVLMIVLLIIVCIVVIIYFVIVNKQKKTINIMVNPNLQCNYGEHLSLDMLIQSIEGNYVNQDIECDQLGIKKIVINFVNQYGYHVSYETSIEVIDNVKPTIMLSGNSYTVTVGSKIDLTKKIISFDDLDDYPKRMIIGEYDLNKVGSYSLIYQIEDHYGNLSQKKFTLIVKNKTNSNNNYVNKIPFDDLYQKYKNNQTLIGFDVSKWQGNIDYDKLVGKIDFVMIKFGGTNGIGKDYYIDSKFTQNMEGFSKLNIPIGLYYYSHARNPEEAIKEAKYLIDNIKDYHITLPIAFDWENWSNYNSYDMSLRTLRLTKDAFIKTINDNGYQGVLYSSKNYLEKFWGRDDNAWLAHYTSDTDYQGRYFMWQRTSGCVVEGISDNTVDFNILYKNNYQGDL